MTMTLLNALNMTSSPNYTTTAELEPEAQQKYNTMQIAVCTVYVIVSFVGLIGNFLTLLLIAAVKSMKTPSNIYLFNLALSDFLFLLTLPLATLTLMTRKWIFGTAMCKIYLGLFGINVFVGVYTLLALSIDRYVVVCNLKVKVHRSVKNSVIVSSITWFLSICLTLPILFFATNIQDGGCRVEWPGFNFESSALGFVVYLLCLGFLLPVLLICVFYSLIIIKIQSSAAPTASAQTHQRKRTRRVTTLVLTVITAYFCCWLPYWTIQVIFLCMGADWRPTRSVIIAYHVATVLYSVNSMLNPLLYGFLTPGYRREVKNLCKSTSPRQSKITRLAFTFIYRFSMGLHGKKTRQPECEPTEHDPLSTLIDCGSPICQPKNTSVIKTTLDEQTVPVGE